MWTTRTPKHGSGPRPRTPTLGVLLCALAWPTVAHADPARFFETRVRPVLIERCGECHGEKRQRGGLRLDSREALLRGGESGPAILAGDPDASLLVRAVRHREKPAMPPETKLPGREISDLTTWVRMGAPWPLENPTATPESRDPAGPGNAPRTTDGNRGFWSFRPVVSYPPPPVRNTAWSGSPLDRFVLAKLEAKSLRPAPPASRRTLIRRLSFDLTGLPPTPDEIAGFLEDESPDACEKVVDRLLASPRHGERWGRHWLDVARYADSNGLDENLAYVHAWRYRDYVLGAFNNDTSFDDFVKEQLAGDLLPDSGNPDDDVRWRIATGFLSVGPKMLACDDGRKMQLDIVDEQVDTTSRAFLALTVGCARCHDHKFDPIPIEDYYSLAAIFKSTRTMENFKVVAKWREQDIRTRRFRTALAAHTREIESSRRRLGTLMREADAAVLRTIRRNAPAYLDAAIELHRFPPPPALVTGKPLGGTLDAKQLAARGAVVIELEKFQRKGGDLVVDTTHYGQGIGVLLSARSCHSEYDISLTRGGPWQLEIRHAAADSRPVRVEINGKNVTDRAAHQVTGSWFPDRQRWFVVGAYPFLEGKNVLRISRSGGPVPHLDKLTLVPIDPPKAPTARKWGKTTETLARERKLHPGVLREFHSWLAGRVELPGDHEEALAAALADAKSPANAVTMPGLYHDDETKARVDRLRKQTEEIDRKKPTPPRAMGVAEGEINNMRVHLRGNYLTLGEEVPRRFPRAIAGEEQEPIDSTRSGRLELARWITSDSHPLTSRVIVNRIWRWHFGAGIVPTPDNFGRLGGRPSHPELLDWLASRFVQSGWSMKALHREIVLSTTYRMSSRFDPDAHAKDPANRLLWRRDRRRLEAEALRDAVLAISGRLDRAIGGQLLTAADRAYVTGTASKRNTYDSTRRSVYLPVLRSAVYQVLQVFDFPDPAVLTGDRPTTTVAPQALLLMNSQFVAAELRALAENLLAREDLDESGRLDFLFLRVLGRPATSEERERASRFLHDCEADYTRTRTDATEVRTGAWRSLARTLLATNEFAYTE